MRASREAIRADAVRADADRQWQRLLSRIRIDADARFKKVFYSALYRTLLHPTSLRFEQGFLLVSLNISRFVNLH